MKASSIKKIFTLFFSLISTLGFCQATQFSGIVHSKLQYFDSANLEVTETSQKNLESHYFVNSIGYKTMNEKDSLTQIYSTKDNIYYFKKGNEWKQIAGTFDFPKLIKIEHLPEEEVIAGYLCKKIKITSSIGEAIYWYSLDLKISKENYSKHLFGNWYDYLKAANGGIALKYEMTMKGSKTISSAYKVEDKVVFKDTEFEYSNENYRK